MLIFSSVSVIEVEKWTVSYNKKTMTWFLLFVPLEYFGSRLIWERIEKYMSSLMAYILIENSDPCIFKVIIFHRSQETMEFDHKDDMIWKVKQSSDGQKYRMIWWKMLNNLVINISMTSSYQLHSQLIEFLEIITCIHDLWKF